MRAHLHPPRRWRASRAWVLAVCMFGGCMAPDPVLVTASDEQLQDGLLLLDERDLSATVLGRTLRVTVPATGALAGPVRVEAALRGLDDRLLGSGMASGPADAPLRVDLAHDVDLASPVVRAGLVVHLRVSAPGSQLRSRRSAVALLQGPSVDVEVPPVVPLGVDVPVPVAAPPATAVEVRVDSPGVTTRVGDTPAIRLAEPGRVEVRVETERRGVPGRAKAATTVGARGAASVVLPAGAAQPGGVVDVLVMGAVDAPESVDLHDDVGAWRWRTRLQRAGAGALAHAVIPVPTDAKPGSTWALRVMAGGGILSAADLPVAAGSALADVDVHVEAVHVGEDVEVGVTARDALDRGAEGSVRMQVVHGSGVVADGEFALVQGRAVLRIPAAHVAPWKGQAEGAVVHAQVMTPDRRVASGWAWIPPQAGAPLLAARVDPCAATGPCTVRAWTAAAGGAPLAADVWVSDGARTWRGAASPDGLAEIPVDAPADTWLTVEACAGSLACASTSARLQRVPTPLPVPPVDVGLQALSTSPLRSLERNRGATFERRWARSVDPLAVPAPGLHAWVDALPLPDGVLARQARAVAVRPAAGTAPSRDVLGAWETSTGSTWTESSCGQGAAAHEVAWGLGGAPHVATWHRRAGVDVAALPAGMAAVLAGASEPQASSSLETQDDWRVIQDHVAADLGLIVAEAQALSREGTVTATRLADWLERRSRVYADPFGRRYRLYAAGGRVRLRSRGPDELADSADDVEAQEPLERLLGANAPRSVDVRPGGSDAVLPGILHARVVVGGGSVVAAPAPACANAVITAASVDPAGALGVVQVNAGPRVFMDARGAWTAGDVVDVPWRVPGTGPAGAGLRVEASGVLQGSANVPAVRPVKGTTRVVAEVAGGGAVRAAGGVEEATEPLEVWPRANAMPIMTRVPCEGSPCSVSVARGQAVYAWSHPKQACARALAQLDPWVPAVASGVVAAAALARDDHRVAAALPWAEEDAHQDPAMAWGLLRAAGAMASMVDLPPEKILALRSAADPVSPAEVPAALSDAWRALALARHDPAAATSLANAVLEAGSADARALALEALALAGDLRVQDVEAVAREDLGPWGMASVVRTLASLGRVAEARALLEANGTELTGFPAALGARAEVASAWCALAAADGSTAGSVSARAGGAPVMLGQDGRIRVEGPVILELQGASWVQVSGFAEQAWAAEGVTVARSAVSTRVGGRISITAADGSNATRRRWRVLPPPGWDLGIPGGLEARAWGDATWLRGEAVTVELRATTSSTVGAPVVVAWDPHVGTWPRGAAPRELHAD